MPISYTEFLALLLQDEVARREQRKFDTLLRQAHFRSHKTLEDFAFDRLPGVNRALVHDLETGRYLHERAPFSSSVPAERARAIWPKPWVTALCAKG
ncbi:ATP-binding protein [Acidithiobacillus ferridurans]|uniref:ATP-binding protein n=1 Tax=Acidithiobacillus ferridurans TaxID=1232575 RepID=UPI0029CA01F5|nr:ATP-binding protein [Acidithiobacillus ferridurans]